ncbi:hypothetical protein KM043_014964 [Ampulex compressa]|nr:hypothetical protein KM043_014964 [Ampulex compressa]
MHDNVSSTPKTMDGIQHWKTEQVLSANHRRVHPGAALSISYQTRPKGFRAKLKIPPAGPIPLIHGIVGGLKLHGPSGYSQGRAAKVSRGKGRRVGNPSRKVQEGERAAVGGRPPSTAGRRAWTGHPREKGEKGVNFLSVKTPLEREAPVFVIGHPWRAEPPTRRAGSGGERRLSGAEISIDPKDGRSSPSIQSRPSPLWPPRPPLPLKPRAARILHPSRTVSTRRAPGVAIIPSARNATYVRRHLQCSFRAGASPLGEGGRSRMDCECTDGKRAATEEQTGGDNGEGGEEKEKKGDGVGREREKWRKKGRPMRGEDSRWNSLNWTARGRLDYLLLYRSGNNGIPIMKWISLGSQWTSMHASRDPTPSDARILSVSCTHPTFIVPVRPMLVYLSKPHASSPTPSRHTSMHRQNFRGQRRIMLAAFG